MDTHLLDTARQELSTCKTQENLQAFHAKYLGKNGLVSQQYKTLKDLSPEEKKQAGQDIQQLQTELEQAFFGYQETLQKELWTEQMDKETIDRSTLGTTSNIGHLTLLSKMRRHAEEVFRSMGFHIEYGHDVVTQRENFQSVNIPTSHPATEMHDTLYLKNTDEDNKPLLLRTHTSAHQVELIKKI